LQAFVRPICELGSESHDGQDGAMGFVTGKVTGCAVKCGANFRRVEPSSCRPGKAAYFYSTLPKTQQRNPNNVKPRIRVASGNIQYRSRRSNATMANINPPRAQKGAN